MPKWLVGEAAAKNLLDQWRGALPSRRGWEGFLEEGAFGQLEGYVLCLCRDKGLQLSITGQAHSPHGATEYSADPCGHRHPKLSLIPDNHVFSIGISPASLL